MPIDLLDCSLYGMEAKMYSMDLRRRVVRALDDGQSIAAVARRFEVARPTVLDWKRRAAVGRLEPDKSGPKGPRKYTLADDAVIHQAIKHNPGVTARSIQPRLSQPMSIASICNRIKQLGYRLKKSH